MMLENQRTPEYWSSPVRDIVQMLFLGVCSSSGGWNSAATSHELFHWKMFAICHIFEGFSQTRCFSQDMAHSSPNSTDTTSCFVSDSWTFQNYWEQGIFWITINDSSASSQPEPHKKGEWGVTGTPKSWDPGCWCLSLAVMMFDQIIIWRPLEAFIHLGTTWLQLHHDWSYS